MSTKIILAGGSGFLGSLLSKYFAARNIQIVILSRKVFKTPFAEVIPWDGKNLDNWVSSLEGAKALINLTGESVNCPHTQKNQIDLINSRVLSTRVLGEALKICKNKPEVWLNASTATIYEHTFDKPHTEHSIKTNPHPDAKDEFSIKIAREWENEFNKAICENVRKIILRISIVFGDRKGSAFAILGNLAKWGLGGSMAGGQQFVSWIHEDDFCRAVDLLINNQQAEGVFNIAAPCPVKNKDMMKILRNLYKMPFGLPASKLMLEVGALFLGTETELIIKSRNVISEKLPALGFNFEYEKFEDAAREIIWRNIRRVGFSMSLS